MTTLLNRYPIGTFLALLPIWVILYLSLQSLADAFIALTGLVPNEHFTEAIRFFIFEVPKVLLLLALVVFGVGIIRTYFSPERTRRILGGRALLTGNVLASVLGIVTPFCSCSAIPLFIGFIEAGIPLGVTFSFLIAAPMINEIAIVLLLGLFGWETTLIYISTGLIIAISSGYILGKLNVERYVEEWVLQIHSTTSGLTETVSSFPRRVQAGYAAVREVIGKVWPYIVLGIAVGAGIHGYVPEDFVSGLLGRSVWWAVPAAVLLGVPLYSNAAGIIPVVHALLEKGALLGTTLAFMMSVIGLSLPETIILRKILKLPLIFIFVGVIASGIVIVGYLFNVIY